MKLLLCQKGHVAIGVKGRVIHIEVVTNGGRGYALVCDEMAKRLIKNEGYEIVDPASYPRDINVLYNSVRKTLRKESLQALLDGISEPISIDTDPTDISGVPIPVFIPSVWTAANDSNWPVTMTYGDTQGNPVSFVFTQDFTLHPCAWCRFKYWLRSKFRRNK